MYCAPPDIMGSNQTYHGSILGLRDALLILEGIRQEVLPQVRRRLNDAERKLICPGSIYAWNETKLGMKRWTDGKNWSASKVKGPFLIYYEHDTDRTIKPNGLVKQSFSLTTKQSEKLHLIAYYNAQDRLSGILRGEVPSQDPFLLKFNLDPSVYRSDYLKSGTQEITVLPPQSNMLFGDVQYPYSIGMRPTAVIDPRIQPLMMCHSHMPHFYPNSHPNWAINSCQLSNIDTQLRMSPPHVSSYSTPDKPHPVYKSIKPDPSHEEKIQYPNKYQYERDLSGAPTGTFREGGEFVPSLVGSEQRTGARTLPSLSEYIGTLVETNGIPKKLLGCSKYPQKEGIKLRMVDQPFSV